MSSPVDRLVADIKIATKRLSETTWEDVNHARLELVNNTYPMMEAVCEQLTEVDNVLAEMESPDSFLDDEQAETIRSAILLGHGIAELAKRVLPQLDDLSRKKALELLTAYDKAAQLALMVVTEANEDDEEDDDEEEDDIEDAEVVDSETEKEEK